MVESQDRKPLAALLVPPIRRLLVDLDRFGAVSSSVKQALRALKGFVTALKVKAADIEVSLDFDPAPGIADSGDLEHDLPDLFAALGQAAKARQSGVAFLLDEIQYLTGPDLSRPDHGTAPDGAGDASGRAGRRRAAADCGHVRSVQILRRAAVRIPSRRRAVPIRCQPCPGGTGRRRGGGIRARRDHGHRRGDRRLPVFPAGMGLPRLEPGPRVAHHRATTSPSPVPPRASGWTRASSACGSTA